jgi:hypothetical protein
VQELDERQATCKITFGCPPSLGVALSRRVKDRRRANTGFSRNDLMREILTDYFRRHPIKDARP